MASAWIEPPAPEGYTPWGPTQRLSVELERLGYSVTEWRTPAGIPGKGISRLELR